MANCARAPPVLFLHVSMLLAVVSGAGLATAARLKWDPSTYIVVRELFPVEYRVTAVALCASSSALLALAHVAGTALSVRRLRVRRALLFTYAVLMTTLMFAEIAWVAWMFKRLIEWLNTPPAHNAMTLFVVGKKVEPYVQFFLRLFSKWHPMPGHIQALIEEAEDDVPRNLYVGGCAVALVAALQPAAVLLALLCARALRKSKTRTSPAAAHNAAVSTCSYVSDIEKTPGPLKIIYRDGKLIRV